LPSDPGHGSRHAGNDVGQVELLSNGKRLFSSRLRSEYLACPMLLLFLGCSSCVAFFGSIPSFSFWWVRLPSNPGQRSRHAGNDVGLVELLSKGRRFGYLRGQGSLFLDHLEMSGALPLGSLAVFSPRQGVPSTTKQETRNRS